MFKQNRIKNNKYLFFFFPYYHTGGSERVHADVVKNVQGCRKIVFITDRSRDAKFGHSFRNNAFCVRFFGLPNKLRWLEAVLTRLLAYIINRMPAAAVFGSNSRFYYRLLPQLSPRVGRIDIIHWLDGAIGRLAAQNTARINTRVVVTPEILPVLENVYAEMDLQKGLLERIQVIENRIDWPRAEEKVFNRGLTALFIGRDSYEKRPWLALKVSELCAAQKGLRFLFIGRGLSGILGKEEPGVRIIDQAEDWELDKLYRQAHIIFSTSLFEGFPLAFMEAMSYGVVPIAPQVGGFARHIHDRENGYLIQEEQEERLPEAIAAKIRYLAGNHDVLSSLSAKAREYAGFNFVNTGFHAVYQKIINDIFK